MNQKSAEQLAHDLNNKKAGVYAKVGSHRTNGVVNYVVHITHDDHGRRPHTIS